MEGERRGLMLKERACVIEEMDLASRGEYEVLQ